MLRAVFDSNQANFFMDDPYHKENYNFMDVPLVRPACNYGTPLIWQAPSIRSSGASSLCERLIFIGLESLHEIPLPRVMKTGLTQYDPWMKLRGEYDFPPETIPALMRFYPHPLPLLYLFCKRGLFS